MIPFSHPSHRIVLPTRPSPPRYLHIPNPALCLSAERIRSQQPKDKNKLYALHAPEVECISKGKARNRYEFGVKVSPTITHRQGLMVGAKRFTGNRLTDIRWRRNWRNRTH